MNTDFVMANKKSRNIGISISKRHIFTILGFFGMFSLCAMRVNLSISMVVMAKNMDNKIVNQSSGSESTSNVNETTTKAIHFDWDSKQQSLIMGSFYYGYMIMQLPGGLMAEKTSAKWSFGCGVFMSSVLCILTPWIASSGIAMFITIRILAGLVEGVTFPAMNCILSQWSPVVERTRISTIIFMGGPIGSIISMPLSGWLCSTDFFGGWEAAFYVFGTFGCIWFMFWATFIYESPMVHPTISSKELVLYEINNCKLLHKNADIPWKTIFTSVPVWAILIAHCVDDLGYYVYLLELPNYLNSVLHFSITENGFLSALPLVAQVIIACIVSFIADKLRILGILKITTIRKLFNTLGLVGPATCLLIISIFDCQQFFTVTFLILGMGLNGSVFSGFHINHIDISPKYAGTLYGITNSCASLSGVIAPALVGAFISDGNNIKNWNKIFHITAVVYIIGAIFYMIFASADKQPWDTKIENSTFQEKKSASCIQESIIKL